MLRQTIQTQTSSTCVDRLLVIRRVVRSTGHGPMATALVMPPTAATARHNECAIA
jgi:hypothetical protein